jgi:hypothetical protein
LLPRLGFSRDALGAVVGADQAAKS